MSQLRLEITAANGCILNACGVALLLVVAAIGGGCGHADEGGGDDPDTDSRPGTQPDAGATPVGCPSIARTIEWKDPDPDVLKSLPRFVWVGDRVVSLSAITVAGDDERPRQGGVQFRKQSSRAGGAIQAKTLWTGGTALEVQGMPLLDVPNGVDVVANGVVAVTNDEIAVVDQVSAADSTATHCSYALARVGDEIASIREPAAFSDLPTAGSSPTASECRVASLGDGFLLIWRQRRATDGLDLFAQRIGPDGAARGERLTLASSETNDSYDWVNAVASDEAGVAVVLRTRVGDGESYAGSLVVVDGAAVNTRPFELPERTTARDVMSLRAVNGGFIAWENWSSTDDASLWLLDHDFVATSGPRRITSGSHVARLDDGYVVVERGEYLTATRLDAALADSDKPMRVSGAKGALLDGAFGDPDGRAVAVPYDDGAVRVAMLQCTK